MKSTYREYEISVPSAYPSHIIRQFLQSNTSYNIGFALRWGSCREDERVCPVSNEELHDAVIAIQFPSRYAAPISADGRSPAWHERANKYIVIYFMLEQTSDTRQCNLCTFTYVIIPLDRTLEKYTGGETFVCL